MISLILILFSAIGISTKSLANENKTECDTDTTECVAYCEISKNLKCDSKNYLLSFGHKYCRRYLDKADIFTKEGKQTLAKIRNCLITTLKSTTDLTCEMVEDVALESHYTCYTQNGFCDLKTKDKLKILSIMKLELFNTKLFPYTKRITESCNGSVRHFPSPN